MQPTGGLNCGDYLRPYATMAGGSIYNEMATSDCEYCSLSNADQFLASVAISFGTRWRDYGIGFAYIIFNIFMAVLLYYLIRVRKGSGKGLAERFAPLLKMFKRDAHEEKTTTEQKQKTG
jgi:ATP-binding cassette subfamily G (WHITE) protein 2 (PDR)